MYIETVPNRGATPAILLREGKRQGKKVIKTTILNLTHWPSDVVEGLRRLLAGDTLVSLDDVFSVAESTPHGHVETVLGMIRQLGLDTMIASQPSRQRDLIVALVAARLIEPCSKLATSRVWLDSTLAREMKVEDADVDELYAALDWLLARQKKIERKLAKRHLKSGGLALYDVSSSSYEGHTCPLVAFGHNRDGDKDLPCIVYGVMTNADGCPVSVQVYPGNTADPATVADQVDKLRKDFQLEHIVLVGDRGMLTSARIKALRDYPQLSWISALRSEAIRRLVETGAIQMSLFDQQNLAEISSPDFPGERLVVCFNPALAEERRRKRDELLAATEAALKRIQAEVKRRKKKPLLKQEIALKVGKVIGRHKVAKHFKPTIEDGRFEWARDTAGIEREQALDGIYVIRTSEPNERLSAPDAVRRYKSLSLVERAFRTLKGMDLRVRPIYLHDPNHVRAHIFLCMLAYYVEWHMRQKLAPLIFDDEELSEDRQRRDPVAPAQPSDSAKRKKTTRQTPDGFMIHSFHTLLIILAKRCRNRCRTISAKGEHYFERITDLTPEQSNIFKLLGLFPVR